MLPVVLPEAEVNELLKKTVEIEGYELTINLETQEVSDQTGFKTSFQIDEFRRYCLLNGLDNIGLTLRYQDMITAYEQTHPQWYQISI
jgi:3-isopropylmalate/(R)-2-methylmalate dehydratase small subunit